MAKSPKGRAFANSLLAWRNGMAFAGSRAACWQAGSTEMQHEDLFSFVLDIHLAIAYLASCSSSFSC